MFEQCLSPSVPLFGCGSASPCSFLGVHWVARIALPLCVGGVGVGGHLPLLWQNWGLRVPTACLYSRTQLWNMGVVVCSVRELIGFC